MKKIYIAGPYRAKTEYEIAENIQHAEKYAKKYWALGYGVFCPHKNSAFFGGVCPDEQFLEADLQFLKMCDIVVMIPGWTQSKGARDEHALAQKLGKEIIYADNIIV